MTSLSAEALMVAAVAVMRDMNTLEDEIAEMGREEAEEAGLGDELVRMTRVLGELHLAYDDLGRGAEAAYPSWQALREQAGRD